MRVRTIAIPSIALGAILATASPASASAPPTPTNLQLIRTTNSTTLNLRWDWSTAATYELSYGNTTIPLSWTGSFCDASTLDCARSSIRAAFTST